MNRIKKKRKEKPHTASIGWFPHGIKFKRMKVSNKAQI